MKWGKLTVLDEWSNTVIVGEPTEFLVVVPLVTGQYRN
jgi:hypothetical protein